jgi:hypothetical protein
MDHTMKPPANPPMAESAMSGEWIFRFPNAEQCDTIPLIVKKGSGGDTMDFPGMDASEHRIASLVAKTCREKECNVSDIATYFINPCPVCGRSLHIPVQLLGQKAICQHCRATFAARDPATAQASLDDPRTALMRRVNTILSNCQATRCVQQGKRERDDH